MRFVISFIFFNVLTELLFAQDSLRNKQDIFVVARQSPDSIVLRWAPAHFDVWRSANAYGYTIQRILVIKNGTLVKESSEKILTTEALKPATEQAWEQIVRRDKYAAIAAQALFGKEFSIELDKTDVLSIVNQVKENEQRFGIALFAADMSRQVAQLSGLSFTDKHVVEGEKYLYRIKVYTPTDTLTGSAFVAADNSYYLPKPLNLNARFEEKTVSLRWRKSMAGKYTAYVVERSTDGANFQTVSSSPLSTLSPTAQEDTMYEYAVDSLHDSQETFYYRVKGMTPFGELGPPSDVINGKAKFSVTTVPYIHHIENINNKSLRINWAIAESYNGHIRRFVIERAFNPGDKFVSIGESKSDERALLDKSPQVVNYYRVCAEDLKGARLCSPTYFAQLIDSLPPSAPSGLQATIDTSGVVLLSWNPGTESDLYGYRVYRANTLKEEMSQLTVGPVNENKFVDKVNLHTLDEHIYYSIIAVDENQNLSPLSLPLEVRLPDKIPPQSAVFLPVLSDKDGITLTWIRSSSSDVKNYVLYRKYRDVEKWSMVKTIAANTDTTFRFVDVDATPGIEAFYTIVCEDEAGLRSLPSSPVSGQRKKIVIASPVEWKEPFMNPELRMVKLSWKEYRGVKQFKIYKSVNGGILSLYKTLDGSLFELVDEVKPGQKVQFHIAAVLLDKSTPLSKPLKFEF